MDWVQRKMAAPWHVVANDVVGGWSISIVDQPPSYHQEPLGRTIVADVVEESTAQHIADLHNAWLDKGALKERIATVVEGSTVNYFRTAESLAQELGADIEDVRRFAQLLIDEGRIRRPHTSDPKYQDWYAPASKPLTWREKLLKYAAMAGREPV